MRVPTALPRVLAALVCAVTVAACGSGSRQRFVATACGTSKVSIKTKLVLSDVAPIPRIRLRLGDAVKVVSSYHGNKMTYPTAHPVSAVCEISQDRDRYGNATVVYKIRRRGKILFASGFTHITPAMDTAMLGRVVVLR